MTPTQLWNRILTRPAPRHPLRHLFAFTGAAFVLGLMLGLFLPSSLAIDQVPVRLDFPFRAAAYGALMAFTQNGVLLLAPSARKLFLVVVLVLIPVVLTAGVALFYPIFSSPEMDFEALHRILPIVSPVIYSALAIVMLGSGAGWFRWAQAVSHNDRNL